MNRFKNHLLMRAAVLCTVLCLLSVTLTGCIPQLIGGLLGELTEQSASGGSHASSPLKEDYYDFINADWLNTAQIGSGVPSINSFYEVSMQTTTDLLSTLMSLGEKAETFDKGSDERLLADFYNSAMDYQSRNKDGLAPVEPFLSAIDRATSLTELTDALIMMDNAGIGSFITWDVSPDFYDSSKNVLYLFTGYIGMPQKEFYHDTDTHTQAIQTAYIRFLTTLFGQTARYSGTAEQTARAVLAFETEMTTAFLDAEQLNDVTAVYNKLTLDALKDRAAGFELQRFFKATGIADAGVYIASSPGYFTMLGKLYTQENLDILKQYATAMVLEQSASFLTQELEAAQTEYSNAINGSTGSLRDIEFAYNTVNDYLGELLSKIYVENYFSDDLKDEVTDMVTMIIDTYKKRLQSLDWMSKQTKQKAILKLDAMRLKIGYPDSWTDYSGVDIRSYEEGGSLYGNIISLYERLCKASLAKINTPVDKNEWGMHAHNVNAYYNPSNNEIVFPAAILQPPFFDSGAKLEANLGGIGVVIAHEISHAFDDNGSKFDENGNINNWWSDADLAAYQYKTQRLVEQYDGIRVETGEYVNGTLTLGENIADLGGVGCVVQVAKEYGNGDLDTLFRSFAVSWRSKCTPEYTSYLLKADTHSPDKYRVNQVLMNIDDFYGVYGVDEGDGMYLAPGERVTIW